LDRTGLGVADLLVVCDTLDLPVGQCRLRRRGSSAGHNGLASIIGRLGREDFMRLYIGIGRPGDPGEVVDYVLGRPDPREAREIGEALRRAAAAVVRLLHEEPEKVMNELNQKAPEP
jgi:PTH1 family peptidyl-tRNA hydrolase